jgi:hypothetical protein
MSIDFDQMDESLTLFESTLNTLGYIPIVSTFSGTARFIYGKVEAIVALAAVAFHFIGSIAGYAGHEGQVAKALPYVVHGFANMGRAVVEMIPLINLSCIFYDLTGAGLPYPSMKGRQVVPLRE